MATHEVVFNWLHLTDVHMGQPGQGGRFSMVRGEFFDYLAKLRERAGPWDAVFFTGDMANWGLEEEFAAFNEQVLHPLYDRLKDLDSGDAAFLAVPGNHDLVRPDANEPEVDCLLNGFERHRENFWLKPDSKVRQVVNGAFANYSAWWKQVPQRPQLLTAGALPGDFRCSLQAGDAEVGIVGLNTTFLQLGGGDFEGRLEWSPAQFDALFPNGFDLWRKEHHLCLLLTHQGPSWFTPTCLKEWNQTYGRDGYFAANFHGHLHLPDYRYTATGGSPDRQRLLLGRSLYGREKIGETIYRSFGFSAGRLTFQEKEARLKLWPVKLTERGDAAPDHDYASLPDGFATAAEAVPLIRPRNVPVTMEPSDPGEVERVFKQRVLHAHSILSRSPAAYRALAESFGLDETFSEENVQKLAVKFSDTFFDAIGEFHNIRRQTGESEAMDAIVTEFVFLAIAPSLAAEWRGCAERNDFLKVGNPVHVTIIELVRAWIRDEPFEPDPAKREPHVEFREVPPTEEATNQQVISLFLKVFPEAKNETDPIDYIRRQLARKERFKRKVVAVLTEDMAASTDPERLERLIGPLLVLVETSAASINPRSSDERYNLEVVEHIREYFGD